MGREMERDGQGGREGWGRSTEEPEKQRWIKEAEWGDAESQRWRERNGQG